MSRTTGSERLYRWLVRRALPGPDRREARDAMVEVFVDLRRRERERGGAGRLLFWPRMLVDLAWTALQERREAGTPGGGDAMGRVAVVGQMTAQAVRTVTRRRASAVLTALTVALGVGAATLAGVLARDVLLDPLPYADADRLVRLRELDENRRQWWPSVRNFVDWRAAAPPEVVGIEAGTPPHAEPVLVGGAAVQAMVAEYSSGLFPLLGVPVVRGRLPTREEASPGGAPVAVVGHAFWRDVLGGGALDDREVLLGTERFPVVGVLPADFGFLGVGGAWGRPDVWIPLERREDTGGRRSHGIHVVARLGPGTAPSAAAGGLDRMAARVRDAHGEPTHAHFVRTTSLEDDLLGGARTPIGFLLLASLGVLSVAGLNLAGTLLVDGLSRSRELAVRRALGAGRARVAVQLSAEAVVAALPGAPLGALFAWAGLEAARFLDPSALPRLDAVRLDGWILAWATLAAVGLAAAAGLAAWALVQRGGETRRVASGGRGGPGPVVRRLWHGMIVLQVTLTVVLVVGAGSLLRSLASILGQDLGYEAEGVVFVHAPLPGSRYDDDAARLAYAEGVLARIRALPGVASASLTDILPHETQVRISGTSIPGGDADASMFGGLRVIDPAYFDVLGIPRVVGEGAAPGPGRDVLVDRSLADGLFPSGAVGRQVRNGLTPDTLTVRGVVGAVREWGLDMGLIGTVYRDFRSAPDRLGEIFFLARGPGGRAPDPAALRRAAMEVDDRVPLRIDRLDHARAGALGARRLVLGLTAVFGLLGLVFAVTGIYGIVGYVARRSAREAGVRLALGARPRRLLLATLATGVAPAALGLAAGVGASYALMGLAAGRVPGLDGAGAGVVSVAVLVLAAAALVAAALPARRAIRVDVVQVLRSE